VKRTNALLAALARHYDVSYVDTTGLELHYLPDRLHLTPAGHAQFGGYVADRLAALG
jgi:acyl-CoA thioesterase-1